MMATSPRAPTLSNRRVIVRVVALSKHRLRVEGASLPQVLPSRNLVAPDLPSMCLLDRAMLLAVLTTVRSVMGLSDTMLLDDLLNGVVR